MTPQLSSWVGILFVQPPLVEVFEPNPEVGNGRGTAVTKTAPDPALMSLSPMEEANHQTVTAQNGYCWDRGSSGHRGFRFVIGDAVTVSNLRGT